MSKKIFALILQVSLLALFLDIKDVNAADVPVSNCPGTTTSSPIHSKSDNAEFTINIEGFYDQTVTKWQVQFECGPEQLQQSVDASLGSDLESITATIFRSGNPLGGCEFFPGNHTLLVKGDNLPRCRGQYIVLDSDSQCELNIEPLTGIIPSTTVKVSGKKLTEGARFYLFIDDSDDRFNPLKNAIGGYVSTPEFSGITIPKDKLTPTRHKVYLKRQLVQATGGLFGPALCPKEFTVGTPDSPGGVIIAPASATPSICTIDPNNPRCTSGEGDPCDTKDNRGPAFKTAIGCIHTNPTELVKDLMTFIIGIGGGLAFLMMLLGAFQMLTSAGNPETLNAGKDRLTSAVIGLLFVIFAILLLQIIGVGILNLPGFGK